MGVAASFVTSLVLALYVQSEIMPAGDHRPTLAWGIVPLILFWQCRLWLVTARGEMHHDPILFAARDWVFVGGDGRQLRVAAVWRQGHGAAALGPALHRFLKLRADNSRHHDHRHRPSRRP